MIDSVSKLIDASANFLGVLGFILSILTYIQVLFNKAELKKINKRNFSRYRLPENLQDLKNISRSLSRLNVDFESNKAKISIEVVKIKPTLKSLKKSLDNHDMEHYSVLNKSVENSNNIKYKTSEISLLNRVLKNVLILDEFSVDDIYRKLTTLITDLENISKDNSQNLLQ